MSAQREKIPGIRSGQLAPSDAAHTFTTIRACLRAFDGAMNRIQDVADETFKERMFEILTDESLDVLLTWFKLFARRSSIVMPDHSSNFGTSSAANGVHMLLANGYRYLEGRDCLERIVDFVLWIWIYGVGVCPPEGTIPSPNQYTRLLAPRLTVLADCIEWDLTRRSLFRKISSFSPRASKDFANAFCHLFMEWAKVYAPSCAQDPRMLNCLTPLNLLNLTRNLSEVKSFSRALVDCNFPRLAMHSCFKFPAFVCVVQGQQSKGTLPALTAATILGSSLSDAYCILRVVPELLDVGLLSVLLDNSLLAMERGFQAGAEEMARSCFEQLHTTAHHPRIVRAIAEAFNSISDSILARSGDLKVWRDFADSLKVQFSALSKVSPGRDPPLCDSLQVRPLCLPANSLSQEALTKRQ